MICGKGMLLRFVPGDTVEGGSAQQGATPAPPKFHCYSVVKAIQIR